MSARRVLCISLPRGSVAGTVYGSPMVAAVAPHPEQFPLLLDRMGELMKKDYDWRPEIAKLPVPTLSSRGARRSRRTGVGVQQVAGALRDRVRKSAH
jgi:hypothetical protein